MLSPIYEIPLKHHLPQEEYAIQTPHPKQCDQPQSICQK